MRWKGEGDYMTELVLAWVAPPNARGGGDYLVTLSRSSETFLFFSCFLTCTFTYVCVTMYACMYVCMSGRAERFGNQGYRWDRDYCRVVCANPPLLREWELL